MSEKTNTTGILPGESYEEWLVRRVRETIAQQGGAAGVASGLNSPDLKRAYDLGALTAWAHALADAMDARLRADAAAAREPGRG